MNKEIEIKLLATREDIQKFLNHDLFKKYVQSEKQVWDVVNTYYDTPDMALRKQGFSLRIRQHDGLIFQTLKGNHQAKNGYTERGEWEYAIDKPQIDITQFPENLQFILKLLLPLLKPLFTTEFKRELFTLILEDKTEIELAIDQGKICAKQLTETISEIELELKHGNVKSLLDYADKLKLELNLRTGNKSKAQRGYELTFKHKVNS